MDTPVSQVERGFELIGTLEYEIGKILSQLKDSKEYNVLGSHVKSWKDALKEIGLTYARAQNLIDVYDVFPELKSVKNYDRLKDIAKLFKFGFLKKEQLPEVYSKAMTLTIKDWTDEKNMLEGKISYLTCDHTNFEKYIRCLSCGKWIKDNS